MNVKEMMKYKKHIPNNRPRQLKSLQKSHVEKEEGCKVLLPKRHLSYRKESHTGANFLRVPSMSEFLDFHLGVVLCFAFCFSFFISFLNFI